MLTKLYVTEPEIVELRNLSRELLEASIPASALPTVRVESLISVIEPSEIDTNAPSVEPEISAPSSFKEEFVLMLRAGFQSLPVLS